MIEQELRARILAQPDRILADREIMTALVGASDRARGSNVIDLRGMAMGRLENRLDQLEDTHRNVIAAAYENLAGTNQVHRAILQLLDPVDFAGFLTALPQTVAPTLRLDCLRLVLETPVRSKEPALRQVEDVVCLCPPGFVATHVTQGRDIPMRKVTLRQRHPQGETVDDLIYGDKIGLIRSEALIRLDFGKGRLPGLLVMGSRDPNLFKPSHGTDLLTFFGGIFERCMRRWLA